MGSAADLRVSAPRRRCRVRGRDPVPRRARRGTTSFSSTSSVGARRCWTETLSSIRPRATRCCTSARKRASIGASDGGMRICKSRKRWLTARTVTPMAVDSSSRVSEANPVMLLIMFDRRGPLHPAKLLARGGPLPRSAPRTRCLCLIVPGLRRSGFPVRGRRAATSRALRRLRRCGRAARRDGRSQRPAPARAPQSYPPA